METYKGLNMLPLKQLQDYILPVLGCYPQKWSENEEAWDKVHARSAMTTKPVEGASELGNQIARLMAALTRAGQGNSPSSTPNSPRHRGHGRGRTDRCTPSHPNSDNDQTGLRQTTSAHSVSAGCGTGTAGQGQGNAQGPKDGQGNTSNKKDSSSLQSSNVKVEATWLGSVTSAKLLNRLGETEGMQANSPAAAANSRL